MTTEIPVGAASLESDGWHQIDWEKAHRNVKRLQARIVKATQGGRWGKVKALQHLLTHSFSGKAMAVKRVTENQGKKTPGIDRETWGTPAKKIAAIHRLRQRGYHPQPLRRTYIPKRGGKLRPLSIPTMLDRAMQALYLLALDPVAETTSDPNSYGFRPERSCADAIAKCFILLARKTTAQWVLEGDIKSCFDQISHNWMLGHIPMDKGILQKWLKAGYIERRILHPTNEGTPQGGIASPVLANLVLNGLEERLRERFPRKANGLCKAKVYLVRYADDFVITGDSKERLEGEVKPLVEQFLRERGLELSQEKTVVTHIEQGFDFLGQNVRKYDGKLLIKPSKKSIQTLLEKIRKIVKENKTTPPGKLILQLNPILKGWAMYHRHVVSKEIFSAVDHVVNNMLWRWAVRRHPTKNRRWIKAKYFLSLGNRNWVFSGTVQGKKDTPLTVQLFHTATLPIHRHIKIQEQANPYDPQWESYFEERLRLKMEQSLRGRRKLLYLWKEQKGICPVCSQKITKITGWHNHHIVWRSKGGSDRAENRVLLHPNCHRQVHSQGLSVAKPCPLEGAL